MPRTPIIVLLFSLMITLPAWAGDIESDFFDATKEGNIAAVKTLLDKGVYENAKDNNGMTVLMWASFLGHTDIVQALLDRAVYINAKDNNGQIALMIAAEEGHTEIVRLIKQAGAKE